MSVDDDDKPKSANVSEQKLRWREYLPKVGHYIWRFLLEVHLFVFALVFILELTFLFASATISGCHETDIRWAGMLFQLFGFLIVTKRLRNSELLFEKPSRWKRITSFFDQFPRRTLKTHTISAQGSAHSVSTASARITVHPGPNTPLPDRVKMLEGSFNALHAEVGEMQTTLKTQKTELSTLINENFQKLKTNLKELEKQVEEAVVGDIHIEWWGVGWFMLGIILASASPEISELFGHARSCE